MREMKPSVNKIKDWVKTKHALPVPDKMCILQSKDDHHLYYIGELDCNDQGVSFLMNSDSQGGCPVEDIEKWAYIEL